MEGENEAPKRKTEPDIRLPAHYLAEETQREQAESLPFKSHGRIDKTDEVVPKRDETRRKNPLGWLQANRVIAGATCLYTVFALLQWCAIERNITESTRAWVTVIETKKPDGSMVPDKPFVIEIVYKNSGRSPAMKFEVSRQAFSIKPVPYHGPYCETTIQPKPDSPVIVSWFGVNWSPDHARIGSGVARPRALSRCSARRRRAASSLRSRSAQISMCRPARRSWGVT
jgi:hypothetical protein